MDTKPIGMMSGKTGNIQLLNNHASIRGNSFKQIKFIKMNRNALVIIDMQNDFCLPTGSLSVPGAMQDVANVADFIIRNKKHLSFIGMTMDSHQTIDISHQCFWEDADGNHPPVFTGIGSDFLEEVLNGKWSPRFYPSLAIKYLKDLHDQGEFKHTIWPNHCVIGTEGAAFVKDLMVAVEEWEMLGNYKQVITKGTNPLTEHYGAFRAQVEISGKPETQLNQRFLKTLEKYQEVYLVGEASSHCVATTLKQGLEYAPNLIHKLVVLDDCMSPVQGCEHLADAIYDDARTKGVRFAKSADITLS